MTTGLFSSRTTGPGRNFLIGRANKRRRDTLDAFAEALSRHGDVGEAAREIGASASYGRVLFARIRAKLGEQAV